VATVEAQATGTGQAFLYVGLVAAVAAVGGLVFGYDTGVISGAILYVRRDFALDATAEGFVVGIVTLGALVGAMGAGGMADQLGRRVTNIIAGVLLARACSCRRPASDRRRRRTHRPGARRGTGRSL
jgi:major inositol transporter-like SP family MFS transporter